MRQDLRLVLQEIGDSTAIEQIHSVSGGSISDAYRVVTEKDCYFVKTNRQVPEDMFLKEAKGLLLLQQAEALAVPEVYFYSTPSTSVQGMIVMEWVEGTENRDTEEVLGRGLASLHRKHGEQYGLAHDNYIGRLPQPNKSDSEWIPFYRDQRLLFQVQLAQEKGCWNTERQRWMEQLVQNLDRWIVEQEVKPSLLHGDLWGGNWITGSGGLPYLIDPAVCYGDRELELAFTELFGGFSALFYDAYREAFPLRDGYQERKPLYQLYYLLVHLNLFGESYGGAVDSILQQYGSV